MISVEASSHVSKKSQSTKSAESYSSILTCVQENRDKEFNVVKCTEADSESLRRNKLRVPRPKENADSVIQCIIPEVVQTFKRSAQHVDDRTILRGCIETPSQEYHRGKPRTNKGAYTKCSRIVTTQKENLI